MANPLLSHLLVLCVLLIAGCGGEDFSAPPANLAEIRAKAKESAKASPKSDVGQPASELPMRGPDVAGADSTGSDSKTDSASNDTATKELPSAEEKLIPQSSDNSALIAQQPHPANTASSEKRQPDGPVRDPATAASVEDQAVTVGGKTNSRLKADQQENESVASAGMSLLDKLEVDDDDKQDKRTGRTPTVRKVIARTGRLAVAIETWFRLRNELSKRFYVAATRDGAKIAASSGERRLGVLSTRVEVPGEEMAWARNGSTVNAVTREKKEITTQIVDRLSGILTAVELVDGGDLVLIGTDDGRLIARSCATLQDWDVYSQDLFAWQDEYRASTKVSDSALRVVRAIDDKRLLTMADDGMCHVWKMADVIQKPSHPLDVTPEQVNESAPATQRAQPQFAVAIPKSRVLSVELSPTNALAAVVTSDEQTTVFQTGDGKVTDTINASQLDDTQPVSAVIEEAAGHLLIGLADGRIFRRSLSSGSEVSGVDDDGQPVDYEVVYAPDQRESNVPITAMQLRLDGTVLYFGRLNGMVSQLDLPRKQVQKTTRLHTGPVIEIRSTRAGVFTIGYDRIAKLTDVPQQSVRGGAVSSFTLPKDQSLKDKQLIEPEESLKKDKFTVRRNFDGDVRDAEQSQLSLLGIRPADPVLALHEHQLRVARDAEQREQIRGKIKAIKPGFDSSGRTSASAGHEPFQVAELPTTFDYQARPLRRVVMGLSDDGMTLAASQYYSRTSIRGTAPDQSVTVWDTKTETVLRLWRRSPGVHDLDLDMQSGVLLPQPLSARMQLYDGSFLPEHHQSLSSSRAPDGSQILVGLTGEVGSAAPVVALLKAGSSERRTGVEAFEGAVPAVAWSTDGTKVYASVRERTQSRLLELDGRSLDVVTELVREPMEGAWKIDAAGPPQGILGVTRILPSPGGKLLATYGHHASSQTPFQFRIWKRAGDRWPQDEVQFLESKQAMLEEEMTDTPLVFVNGQDAAIALIGPNGVGIVNTRTGDVDDQLELPDVAGRRPVTLFSPDGKWLFAGDQEGQVWVWALRSLKRKPKQFAAQAGPITGLVMSQNSEFLATAGEENRIRVWDVHAYLSDSVRSTKR